MIDKLQGFVLSLLTVKLFVTPRARVLCLHRSHTTNELHLYLYIVRRYLASAIARSVRRRPSSQLIAPP